MISFIVDIWTYKIADHHFHCILDDLVNFVTPMVFPVKNDRHKEKELVTIQIR